MTKREQSKGKCNFCGKEFAKGGISRHLETCDKRKAANSSGDVKFYHLHIAGRMRTFTG